MSKVTLKTKQAAVLKTFGKLLYSYELTQMEIDLLCGMQGLIIERLHKDGKL
jgi:hypothetical protein